MTTRDPEPNLDDHVAPPVTPETSLTDWSMVYRAADLDGADHEDAWESLVRRYWPAIYAYVRKSGRNVHEASDLTQGFVCDVVIGRRLLASADPTRGRFRTLLLTSLRNYLVEQHRHATRQKRAPDGTPPVPVDLDDVVSRDLVESATPEAAFADRWTAQLVHCVIERVRLDCEAESLGTHWQVFEARVVRPMLHGESPVPYAALVEQFDLQDTAQAQNMMITIKRRFARLLHQEVGQTVHDPAEIEEELFALLRPEERPHV